MTFSEGKKELFAALVKAQKEIKNPIKNQINRGVQGAPKYANLEDTLADYVRPVLTKYGLGLTQDIFTENSALGGVGRVGVSTIIFHESGEYMQTAPIYCEVVIPVSNSGKEILTHGQATGVCITYLRRYSLNAALGINGDKDTDGSFGEIEREPMTYEKALDYELTFGKHQTHKLRDVYKNDRNYIEWLLNNEKTDEEVKEAIKIINAEIAKANAAKAEKKGEKANDESRDAKMADCATSDRKGNDLKS